ncbi:MAG: cadmium-translocating P-type ATPase [Acidobacteria bacterium]|nr:cadmium-translocating P-type ATPase [Acidobacteriota bacterium]
MPVLASVTLPVSGMTCAACQAFLQRTLEEHPGVTRAAVHLLTHSATVQFDPARTSIGALVEAINRTGYQAEPPAAHLSLLAEQDRLDSLIGAELRDLGSKAAASLAAGILAMTFLMPYPQVQFALTLVIAAWAGGRFYTKGWSIVRHGGADMNTLIALGTGAAFLYSTAAAFLPGFGRQDVYFESVIVIIGFVLSGNWLEKRASRQTSRALRELARLQPATARRQGPAGEEEVPIESLRAGDQVALRPGERVPADGVIVEGATELDESMLTGEPFPVPRAAGQAVTGGSINRTAPVVFRVTAAGGATVLSRLVLMLHEAQSSRAPVERLTDRISRVFVPAVTGVAVVTGVVWAVLGQPIQGLLHAVTVLVIACPCALGLAVPAAVMAATGRAARAGILIRGGEALERLARIHLVAFDKTGTLTEGRPAVTGFESSNPEAALARAAALAARSSHPLAQAVAAFAGPARLPASQVEERPGLGMTGRVQGEILALGGPALMREFQVEVEPQGTTVLLASSGRLEAQFHLADPLRPTASAAVRALGDLGIGTALISGDGPGAVREAAAAAGIQEAQGGLLPQAKLAAIRRWQAAGKVVAMAGDGINDGAALAQADAGFAIAAGSDLAREAASVTLLRADLTLIPKAIQLARRTRAIVRQNLGWAFVYNAMAIPIAMGALETVGLRLTPVLASGAMALSSLSVVLNSLRLAKY